MENKLKLEVGKSYRTRGGERVDCIGFDAGDPDFPFSCRLKGIDFWYADDGQFATMTSCRDNDLIAPWEDEAAADADGWIEWHVMPVPEGTKVDVKTRSGRVHLNQTAGIAEDDPDGHAFDWEHSRVGSDIIAYRLCDNRSESHALSAAIKKGMGLIGPDEPQPTATGDKTTGLDPAVLTPSSAFRDNGGPAYPHWFNKDSIVSGGKSQKFDGMTLRDKFAGDALLGIVNDPVVWNDYLECPDGHEAFTSYAAELAYEFADAMLKARGE